MTDAGNVLTVFKDRYGNREQDAELLPLCSAACRETEYELKNPKDCNDIRILNLCAARAYLALGMKRLTTEEAVTSFRAGDVTVSISPQAIVEYGEKELERALVSAAPLLRDLTFCFRQVRV